MEAKIYKCPFCGLTLWQDKPDTDERGSLRARVEHPLTGLGGPCQFNGQSGYIHLTPLTTTQS